MTEFMHKLAEGLRAREQYLEDHSEHPVFQTEEGDIYKKRYDKLVAEWKEFTGRIDKLAAAGEDYDEHFEQNIQDEQRKLSLKIDAWAKTIEK